MPNFIPSLGGQETATSWPTKSPPSYRELKNIISTPEGLKPIQSVCDPIGEPILMPRNLPMTYDVGQGFVVLDNELWTHAFIGVTTNRDTFTTAMAQTDMTVDNHGAAAITAVIQTTDNSYTTVGVLDKSFIHTKQYMMNFLRYNKKIIGTLGILNEVDTTLLPTASGDNIIYEHSYGLLDPFEGKATPQMDSAIDVKSPTSDEIPYGLFLAAHAELLLLIGGSDTYNVPAAWVTQVYTVGTIVTVGLYTYVCTTAPTGASTVSPTHTSGIVTETDGYAWKWINRKNSKIETRVRWNQTGEALWWHPDFTNVPASWLSGYVDIPTESPIIDYFIFYNTLYVVTNQTVFSLSKVGGTSGYVVKDLGISFGLHSSSVSNCVSTSKGVFFITSDGLYVFNGQSIQHPAGDAAEGVFSTAWLQEKGFDNFFTFADSSQPVQFGQHMSDIDSIFWWMNYLDGSGNSQTVILVYNYESGGASYLQPAAGKHWHPLRGDVSGIVEYDTPTFVSKCFAIRKRQSGSNPPVTDYKIESGFWVDPEAAVDLNVQRLMMYKEKYPVQGAFDGHTCTLQGFTHPEEALVVSQAQTVPTTNTYMEYHMQARYINFILSGTVNLATFGAVTAAYGSGNTIKTFAVQATGGGSRL